MTEIKIAVSTLILNDPRIPALKRDFKAYKGQGTNISSLGRDGDFECPYECKAASVWHLHLIATDNPTYGYRVQNDRKSDVHLIYCWGEKNPNVYFFIDIHSPNAHEMNRQNDRMIKIGNAAAKWRAAN